MPVSTDQSLNTRLATAVAHVRSKSTVQPRVGVVLGSGLGAFGDTLGGLVKVPFAEVPGMPSATVQGHSGNVCLGSVGATGVACLQGRVHAYEGHPMDAVVFGVRLLARLGCEVVLLTNAAGGVNVDFRPGDLMLLEDHINFMGTNPLVGPNDDTLGPRFPDLTTVYDPKLRDLARRAAEGAAITLRQGVYAAMSGPCYETPAEVRMLRALGADAVGMSTVPEAIALRHMGIRVGAMSCITNAAAGVTGEALDHAEVEHVARATREGFVGLLQRWIELTGGVLS